MSDDLRLIGLDDLARLLNTDKENIRLWATEGRFPCVRVGRRGELKASLAMVEAWQRGIGAAAATSQFTSSGKSRLRRAS